VHGREHAAKRAGFPNDTAYRRAKQVVDSGNERLIADMDEGKVS